MTIKQKLWAKFSEKIRLRDADDNGYVSCVSCGHVFHWKETDCGHFIENTERSKTFGGNALWYDVRNFAAQCQGCNRFNTAQAKREWTVKFIAEHGQKVYDDMLQLKRQVKKWTQPEVENIIASIQTHRIIS